jgi:hypothetical protein
MSLDMMDRQAVSLDIAVARTLLVPLAQGDRVALHPTGIDGLGGVGIQLGLRPHRERLSQAFVC